MKTYGLIVITALLSLFSGAICAQGYSVGDKAADFNLPAIDGSQVSMADYQDAKGFILIFTCNTCPYAQAYEDRIIALNDRFAPQGYPVLAINPNNPELQPGDSFEKMKQRAAAKKFTFPYLLDEGQEVYPRFGATRTPHVFVVQREGSDYFVRYIGAVDDNYKDAARVDDAYTAQAVDALLRGAAVPVTNTRAIGCSIKA